MNRLVEFRAEARTAFTLVEMLVAMAVTLLLMAALARAFGFVSKQVRDGRSNTQLANTLRDVTTRLGDELERCTVGLNPSSGDEDPLGYFLYYEGPVTDATSSLFRAIDDPEDPGRVVLNEASFGDFDDYIAFTAIASGDSWFTGKVPRYLLDQRANEGSYTLPSPPDAAFEPVMIRSKYAEIVYFASPEYDSSSPIARRRYTDVDGDLNLGSGTLTENGIPDRIRIHRRVLLIRPDLNLQVDGLLPIQTYGTTNFMQPDSWPTAASGSVASGANVEDAWLYGMAGIHQQCDLSVRRALDANGRPSNRIAANSLGDLSQPHNRFAHVRAPARVLDAAGIAGNPSSMPVLALGSPATILRTQTSSGTPIAPPMGHPTASPVSTPARLSGFLRWEFVLGEDTTHNDPGGQWGRQRVAEDVVINNVRAFDVQIFDPEASFFAPRSSTTTTGIQSVTGPSDAGYREAVLQAISETTGGTTPFSRDRGGFVDLAYPVLAGGAIRGWQERPRDRRATTGTPIPTTGGHLRTRFSGVDNYNTGATADTAYTQSLYRSGRVVASDGVLQLFQPAFDTYTYRYERDGFLQRSRPGGQQKGTLWWTTSALTSDNVDRATDGLDSNSVFGADDLSERETSPPFPDRATAIRVQIRIVDPGTRLIRQSSVVYNGR